jgi:hypothetical protein
MTGISDGTGVVAFLARWSRPRVSRGTSATAPRTTTELALPQGLPECLYTLTAVANAIKSPGVTLPTVRGIIDEL